jgi:hypothetical protein
MRDDPPPSLRTRVYTTLVLRVRSERISGAQLAPKSPSRKTRPAARVGARRAEGSASDAARARVDARARRQRQDFDLVLAAPLDLPQGRRVALRAAPFPWALAPAALRITERTGSGLLRRPTPSA